MYVNTDGIKAGFYRVVKKMLDEYNKPADTELDMGPYNFTEQIKGMVGLVEELTKEEE